MTNPRKGENAEDLAGLFARIDAAYRKGNLGRVEQLCRQGVMETPDAPWWPYFHALTAYKLGLTQAGLDGCATVRCLMRAGGELDEVTTRLAALETALGDPSGDDTSEALQTAADPRYLLIKTWGYGFWSDIGHFVTALLAAEMTGRIPVIHWGSGCRYTDEPEQDAFTTFFKPINNVTLADMEALDGNCFPAKWTRDNLRADRFDQWSGVGARQSGLYLLNRPEQVVVADFYTQIFELTPWLAPDHWLAGASPLDALSRLYQKYFTLRPEIQTDIDSFIKSNFEGHRTLAVHVRNADKAAENTNFDADVAKIMPLVDDYVARDENLRIFLLTDSSQAVDAYRARYGDRVLFTDSARAEGDVGIHVQTTGARRRLGVEVIKDTYMAAACDEFIGLGYSNVPCMVSVLKDWPSGSIHLIGGNRLLQENLLLHDW
jgi:protein O-GlcNAc transferase